MRQAFPTRSVLSLALLAGVLAPAVVLAQGEPELPSGYAVVSRLSVDLDGKPGLEQVYLVLPTASEGTPRLWVYRGGVKALDWGFTHFDNAGALGASTRSEPVLQAQELTGDHRPELLVRVFSRGKQSTAATYVFGWDGARFRNLIPTELALRPGVTPLRALVHSPAGGVGVRQGVRNSELVVWDAEKSSEGAPGRVTAQFLVWDGQAFVPGKSMRSGRTGKAALQELGLQEAPAAPRPARKETQGLFITSLSAAGRPICDQD